MSNLEDHEREQAEITSSYDDRLWLATAIQMGTNDRMSEVAETEQAVRTKLYGQAYGPQWGSVQYFRIPRLKEKNDA